MPMSCGMISGLINQGLMRTIFKRKGWISNAKLIAEETAGADL